MLFFLFISSIKLEKRAGIKPTTFSLWSQSIFLSHARMTRPKVFLGHFRIQEHMHICRQPRVAN